VIRITSSELVDVEEKKRQPVRKRKGARSVNSTSHSPIAPHRLAAVLNRCQNFLVEVDIDINMLTNYHSAHHSMLKSLSFPHLRHLRLCNIHYEAHISELTELVDAVCNKLSTGDGTSLKSIALEEISCRSGWTEEDETPSAPAISFGDYFTRFSQLEALTVTAAPIIHPSIPNILSPTASLRSRRCAIYQ